MTPEEIQAFKESLKPKRYNHMSFWVRYREVFGDLEKEQEMLETIECFKDFLVTHSCWEAKQVLRGKRLPLKNVYLVMGSGGSYKVKDILFRPDTDDRIVTLVDGRQFTVKETEFFFFL